MRWSERCDQVTFDLYISIDKELSEEEQRSVSEQLTEEELALFDILAKPEIDMTVKEKEEVKKAARTLLQTLKEAKLVLDWQKKQRSRADVHTTVKTVLDEFHGPMRRNCTSRSATRFISTCTTFIRAKDEVFTQLRSIEAK